jgi:hypothetical protein
MEKDGLIEIDDIKDRFLRRAKVQISSSENYVAGKVQVWDHTKGQEVVNFRVTESEPAEPKFLERIMNENTPASCFPFRESPPKHIEFPSPSTIDETVPHMIVNEGAALDVDILLARRHFRFAKEAHQTSVFKGHRNQCLQLTDQREGQDVVNCNPGCNWPDGNKANCRDDPKNLQIEKFKLQRRILLNWWGSIDDMPTVIHRFPS